MKTAVVCLIVMIVACAIIQESTCKKSQSSESSESSESLESQTDKKLLKNPKSLDKSGSSKNRKPNSRGPPKSNNDQITTDGLSNTETYISTDTNLKPKKIEKKIKQEEKKIKN